jgi:hypothetical protein
MPSADRIPRQIQGKADVNIAIPITSWTSHKDRTIEGPTLIEEKTDRSNYGATLGAVRG